LIRRNYIHEKWEEFAAMVLPPGCSTVQRWETRRAFYAGVEGLFKLILVQLTPGPDPQTDDLQMFADMEAELADFAKRIKEGTA
jgi:hypothetical protein